MEKKSRRKFSSDFKAKVALEALREHHTIEEIARKYELHPTQINQWKREAVSRLSQVFGKHEQDAKQEEEMKEKLYAQIGQLKVENDFLKKKLR